MQGRKGFTYDPEKQDHEPGIHKGKDATNLEKQGIDTAISQHNRRVKFNNFLRENYRQPNVGKDEFSERIEELRLVRGSAMAARDASLRSQSSVAPPPVNRSEKATEQARQGAILAARQNQSWQERIERSGKPLSSAPKSFQERTRQTHNDMEMS